MREPGLRNNSHLERKHLFSKVYSCLKHHFLFFEYFSEKGKPTTIFSSLYVESFGNIEEANMVCIMHTDLVKF